MKLISGRRGILTLVVVMLVLAGFLLAERVGWVSGADPSSCQSARVYCEK